MKKTRDAFSACHPIINFVFFISAIFFGMFFMHPAYLACSLILSGAYYITIKGSRGWKYILSMLPLIIVLSVLNPIFNSMGDTILFTYFNDRTFTMEALLYGVTLSLLFVSVIIWFADYNAVMTSDKFLYLFGKLIPSLSLVLTMILRFVPSYQKHIIQISGARKCIGKSAVDGTKKEMVENGITIVSALTSWALEGGVIVSDSMRSRGFGSGNRSSFSIYKWDRRDCIVLIFMTICIGAILVCIFAGGMRAEFLPTLSIEMNSYTIAGMYFYILFLAIPTVMNIWEDIIWHILRSKI